MARFHAAILNKDGTIDRMIEAGYLCDVREFVRNRLALTKGEPRVVWVCEDRLGQSHSKTAKVALGKGGALLILSDVTDKKEVRG